MQGSKYEGDYQDIEKYCMFIGYPRSGHSLVGSLLDAHPYMLIAHELDALRYIQVGFSKKQLYHLIILIYTIYSLIVLSLFVLAHYHHSLIF